MPFYHGSILTSPMLLKCAIEIDVINTIRSRQPGLEALYLLMPTTQNIDRIIADFSTPGQEMYAGAHLFFTEGALRVQLAGLSSTDWQLNIAMFLLIGLAEPLFQKLTSSPAEPHLKGLSELFINFTRELDSGRLARLRLTRSCLIYSSRSAGVPGRIPLRLLRVLQPTTQSKRYQNGPRPS